MLRKINKLDVPITKPGFTDRTCFTFLILLPRENPGRRNKKNLFDFVKNDGTTGFDKKFLFVSGTGTTGFVSEQNAIRS